MSQRAGCGANAQRLGQSRQNVGVGDVVGEMEVVRVLSRTVREAISVGPVADTDVDRRRAIPERIQGLNHGCSA